LLVGLLTSASFLNAQRVLSTHTIDDSLEVTDFYYRKHTEINGFILKILKENGRGDGNFTVLDYIDLKEKGFLRREKFKLQYFDNDFNQKWELQLSPDLYLSVPKPFYQIRANNDFIYFFESGAPVNATTYSCKVTQIDYQGNIVNVSDVIDLQFKVFNTFPSDRGLYIVGHRFLQGPEYYMGSFSFHKLQYNQKKIKLEHSQKEISNWNVNKSEYEDVDGNFGNNYTWLRKAYIVYPMSDDEGVYSAYCKVDTSGKVEQTVKIDFDPLYRNFLGIDTECYEELNKLITVVLKGVKTGPFFDIYVKDLNNNDILHKEWHFYDLKKYLRSEYPYYDYREIVYNHYRNVDHFSSILYDSFNHTFVLIDKVPDGTYFFHFSQQFDLKRIDYAKEFNVKSNGEYQYSVGIVSGISTIYSEDGYYPRKTALDHLADMHHDNPWNYYYTVFSRKHEQLLIVDDLSTRTSKGYKISK
jgi:predicted secreted protein